VLVKGISVAVSDTDFEGVESRENVELGDGDLREGIEAHSVTEQDEVQPSRTTPAARVRPVFMSEFDEHVALFVGHLRGHGAEPTRVTYALAIPMTRSMSGDRYPCRRTHRPRWGSRT